MKRLALSVFVLAASASFAPAARAQATDETTAEARARFREGVALYDEGRYEAARLKFKETYALKKHPDVLLNLGWSSLKSGHPQEAEDAFAEYLRESKDAPPAKRAEAEKGLAQAKAAGGGGGTGGGGAGGAGGGGGGSGDNGTAPAPAPPPYKAPQKNQGTAAVGTDTPASADAASADPTPVRIEGLLGFTSDNQNFGIGIRAGKVVASHVFVGGTFIYDFGRSYTVATPFGSATTSTSAFYIGPEVGYEIYLSPQFNLRPYGGIGLVSLIASTSSNNANQNANSSNTDSRLVFWPGMAAIYDIPGSMFEIGGDIRFVFIPGGPAIALFFAGGVRF